MFKTRLLSGILLVAIALATIIPGNDILFVLLLLISLIGMSELYKVSRLQASLPGIVGYAAAAAYYLLIRLEVKGPGENRILQYIDGQGLALLVIVFLIVLMAVYVFSYPKYVSEEMMLIFFGVFYVAVMLSYVYRARMIPEEGAYLVWLVFLCSWGCDTCAYCVGMLIGKHKMSPKLSPKKSVEGAVGGVVGAALLGALYAAAVSHFADADASPVLYALICGAGGLISMVGDLAASAIKRNHNIKDYGKLIPGHGGILDRFDSVIFTAPIIYYLSIFFI